ncbi:auxin-induced protein 5NG4-like protein [Corchorus olitorius]|uniref:Auxin-induced protein 5NG4-like protein n=1 Tax=Corchorus olitorius TaxID=93759 RepID=A0A1R3KRP8_9ROSI|nr:auxin-induced protein 5NG4-like protein [Corchorus olitorius]
MACALKATFGRYKPHLSMLLYQICVAIVYFITEAAFNQGLNPHVYVTYRMTLGGFLLIPFAFFIERNSRPQLTLALFLELFLVSILGMEIVNVKSARGIAKILGTLISLAGAMEGQNQLSLQCPYSTKQQHGASECSVLISGPLSILFMSKPGEMKLNTRELLAPRSSHSFKCGV